jgi:hypothetical protein
MEQMFLQVWDKLGTPLTVIFWGYIIMYTLAAVGAFIVFFIVLRMFWKDRAPSGRNCIHILPQKNPKGY